MGDFNAKIGKEKSIRSVAERFSLYENMRDNGLLMAQYTEMHRMIIKSTCFSHKNIHKRTWKRHGSKVVNQNNYIIVSSSYASAIIDVRMMRSHNCDTDHHLVLSKNRQQLDNIQKEKSVEKKK